MALVVTTISANSPIGHRRESLFVDRLYACVIDDLLLFFLLVLALARRLSSRVLLPPSSRYFATVWQYVIFGQHWWFRYRYRRRDVSRERRQRRFTSRWCFDRYIFLILDCSDSDRTWAIGEINRLHFIPLCSSGGRAARLRCRETMPIGRCESWWSRSGGSRMDSHQW